MALPNRVFSLAAVALALALGGCTEQNGTGEKKDKSGEGTERTEEAMSYAERRLDIYAPVTLTGDLSHLSADQKEMIGKLIDASKIMDSLFWRQSWGDRDALMAEIEDQPTRRFAEINYGPWDRLADNRPFVEGIGPKPEGANFYPEDMSREEFEQAELAGKTDLYTVLRRNANGKLEVIPYHEIYSGELEAAAKLLREAASLADHEPFAEYLRMRAEALLTSEYRASDMAWMDMKSNPVDLVFGPIETYEDRLFGYKAAFESFVLIKDQEWSDKLSRFTQFLPELQDGLPVPEKYKAEEPGTDADLNAYDAVYYAGDANAGAKTIAINLPNDEKVQLEKGTRRLQLKNAMRAKFDKILMPISEELIAEDQRKFITFNAFFSNTMFHEVAHGLGIKNTVDGSQTVREALKEHASALEEGKADILGLHMITELFRKGEITEGKLMDYYVTFMASIFRSVRFGASSAHGRANMIRFNYFKEAGAFARDEDTGTYRVHLKQMQDAMVKLSRRILTLQGDGDYEGVANLVKEKGRIGPRLRKDLDRLDEAGIPVDIVFRQGKQELGL